MNRDQKVFLSWTFDRDYCISFQSGILYFRNFSAGARVPHSNDTVLPTTVAKPSIRYKPSRLNHFQDWKYCPRLPSLHIPSDYGLVTTRREKIALLRRVI